MTTTETSTEERYDGDDLLMPFGDTGDISCELTDEEEATIVFEAEAHARYAIEEAEREAELDAAQRIENERLDVADAKLAGDLRRSSAYDLRADFISKAEGFKFEYKERVLQELYGVELDIYKIRLAYLKAIGFPMAFSCNAPLRTPEESLELAHTVEILTGETLESATCTLDDCTFARVAAEVEQVIMRHLIAKITA